MPVLKFFLDLYYDDFGTFRNIYHSLGGVYLQIGNMPRILRKQLKNHFILGFVPFGAEFKDFFVPFIEEIQKLEKGFVMNINNQDYWIMGGLGIITADLPLAGILRHNATYGCRNCKASKENLTNSDFNAILNGRYHQITDNQFLEISRLTTAMARAQKGTMIMPFILYRFCQQRHVKDAYLEETYRRLRLRLSMVAELILANPN